MSGCFLFCTNGGINILLAFQILLIVFMILFGMGSIGARDREHRLQCVSVTIASILGMCFTFWIG